MYALAIAGHSLRCAGAALDIEDAAGILARDVLARLLRGERDPFGAPPPPEIPHRPFGRPRPVHNT